ncbi:MAG: DNA pilot protein [Microvirus sp.]|nr:MAG: DNA pilot protein [Microvirus sp.]
MGLKKFVKKVGRTFKKVAPLALAAGGSYLAARSMGMLGGVGSGAEPTQPSSAAGNTLPRVTVEGNSPSWLSQNAGSLISGGLSLYGGMQANAANSRQAQNQMDFQREMSNTSYQRGTQDMMDAGLNPMLAYSQGGASAPGGASASIEDAVTPALNSGRASAMMKAQLQNLELTNDNLAEQTDNLNAQTAYTRATTPGAGQVPAELEHKIKNLISSGRLTDTQERQLRELFPDTRKKLAGEAVTAKATGAIAHRASFAADRIGDLLDRLPENQAIINSGKAAWENTKRRFEHATR